MRVTAAETNPAQSSARIPGKLETAAAEFEALLIAQMLRTARESGATASEDENAGDNSSLYEMAEQQFAQVLANKGGLGIAKMVVAGLTQDANR
jgi:Rod binding domain-containing protein